MNAETESREVWAEGMLAKILRPAAKKKYLEENESLDNIVKAEAARLVNAVDRLQTARLAKAAEEAKEAEAEEEGEEQQQQQDQIAGATDDGVVDDAQDARILSNMAKKAEHVTLLLKDEFKRKYYNIFEKLDDTKPPL